MANFSASFVTTTLQSETQQHAHSHLPSIPFASISVEVLKRFSFELRWVGCHSRFILPANRIYGVCSIQLKKTLHVADVDFAPKYCSLRGLEGPDCLCLFFTVFNCLF